MTNKPGFGLITMLVLCILVSPIAMAKNEAAADYGYTSADQESYMTEDVFLFFRPGIEFELISFEIPDDLQPLVTFSLKDPGGVPLDMDGIYTPGPIDVRFMLTYIPDGEENKVNYHERSRDRGGVYTTIGDGVYTYKFATVLPTDYQMDSTHTLSSVATRSFRDQEFDKLGLEGRYYDNDVYNFVPSGAAEPMPRDIVSTATCNRCHDPLGEHGGRYQEVQVCQSCHNPDLYNEELELSYSFAPMIHRVHAGTEPEVGAIHYPGVLNDCATCHTGGIPTADMPLVLNPNPSPSCDGNGLSMTDVGWGDEGSIEIHVNAADGPLFAASGGSNTKATGKWVTDGMAFFMVDAATGEVIEQTTANNTVFGCAGNAPGAMMGEAAALHTNWMTRPSREVCGACHIDIDFENGEGHPPQSNDDNCGMCHQPSGEEYGFTVAGAHTVDYQSVQLGGFLVNILDVTNTGPGQTPVVEFTMTSKSGRIDPADINRLRMSISGPNTDFSFYAQESVDAGMVWTGSSWKYQFETALPDDAMGSYSIGVEGRLDAEIDKGFDGVESFRDQMQNFIVPFAVTDTAPMSRRMVVDDAKCESCHTNLSLHGSNRHNATEYCQTCHMPGATDEAVRPEGEGAPESIDFRYMVHKIHRGAELENGYVVYGYRSSLHDYSDVEYVGDLRNCEACHVNDSYTLPLPDGALAVTTPRDWWTPMLPETAACVSCHDGKSAKIHADSNTSDLGEACSTCHGTGKTYSVEAVHAR